MIRVSLKTYMKTYIIQGNLKRNPYVKMNNGVNDKYNTSQGLLILYPTVTNCRDTHTETELEGEQLGSYVTLSYSLCGACLDSVLAEPPQPC
jgi:hypothetical protein